MPLPSRKKTWKVGKEYELWKTVEISEKLGNIGVKQPLNVPFKTPC